MHKCGLNASRSDSGVMSSSVSESGLSASERSEQRPQPVLGLGGHHEVPHHHSQDLDHEHPGAVAPSSEIAIPRPLSSRPQTEAEVAARKEREERSIAIEKAYVHDVYEQISQHISDNRYRAWPRVRQFLQDLEPGSIVCDVGCGSGKYLSVNPMVFNIGSDRCHALAQIAREKEHEVLLCDNLSLPFRDSSLDAVLSVAVIHHMATAERRVKALREMSRVLRVGGRVMISVWAMEQRHRRFESQDVLIPWHKPTSGSCGGGGGGCGYGASGSIGTATSMCGCPSTTTATSDDDVTHYHAYTQTSDSGNDHRKSFANKLRLTGLRRRATRSNQRKAGRSFDPGAAEILEAAGGYRPPYQSSSDLSSPNNETCYSFVKKAIQKLSHNKQNGAWGITAESLSEGGHSSSASKFSWLSLSGLERLAALQAGLTDEDLEGLDSASTVAQKIAVARAASAEPRLMTTTCAPMTRDDSNESQESSIGDLPIELPHLAEEDDLFNLAEAAVVPVTSRNKLFMPKRGRSKSLDGDQETDPALRASYRGRAKPPSLVIAGRAATLDMGTATAMDHPEQTNLRRENPEAGAVRRSSQADSHDDHLDERSAGGDEDQQNHRGGRKMLKDFKTTLSASLKSIDISIRSGSITSISSGKSFVSNFSVKSDSGISLPAPKQQQQQHHLQKTAEAAEVIAPIEDTSKKLGRRPWESEPLLETSASSKKSERSSSRASLNAMGEKEKSRAMQSVESKLMKAIKEVNESDLSESNTPMNSPGPLAIRQQSKGGIKQAPKNLMTAAASSRSSATEAASSTVAVGESESLTSCDSGKVSGGEDAAASQQHQQEAEKVEDEKRKERPPRPPRPPKPRVISCEAATEESDNFAGESASSIAKDKVPVEVEAIETASTDDVVTHHPDLEQLDSLENPNYMADVKEGENAVFEDAKDSDGTDSETDGDGDVEDEGEGEVEDIISREAAVGMTFDELKKKVRSMPKFNPFVYTGKRGGSVDSGSRGVVQQRGAGVQDRQHQQERQKSWVKQQSLHDELLSHERLTANEEMRKKIQKQQSLPEHRDIPRQRQRSIKEGLLDVVSKSKQFESLKQSLANLKKTTTTTTEEKEEDVEEEDEDEGINEDSRETSDVPGNQSATIYAQAGPRQAGPHEGQQPQSSGQAIRSGIVRIWQSWRSGDKGTDGQSFTRKRGVSIQPIDVRGREAMFEAGGAASRRSIFQRRRGGSSPLSPQQLEALAKEDSMSPTSFRRCCMDCPGGELVFVEQQPPSQYFRERKLSRGGDASDSSKDGSIQSDTSIDSEDSCVSVIFVPHPEGRFGLTGDPGGLPVEATTSGSKFVQSTKRKQSNSSESSESNHSGMASPILSPGVRATLGSPIKSGVCTTIAGSKGISKIELYRQSGTQYEAHTIVARNLKDGESGNNGNGNGLSENQVTTTTTTMYCASLPLEKIDERHTESESEAERETTIVENQNTKKVEAVTEAVTEAVDEETKVKVPEEQPETSPADNKKSEGAEKEMQPPRPNLPKFLQRRLSTGHKSFEMEDIPDENPIKCHPESLAQKRKSRPHKLKHQSSMPTSSTTTSASSKSKYDYPIVRHHPLFAKQPKPGAGGQSNFSSLLMGRNVRIIRAQTTDDGHTLSQDLDIFNPETDDLDSDDEEGTASSDSSDGNNSRSPTSSDSSTNSSVESVVSAARTAEESKETSDKQDDDADGGDDEFTKKAEKRRQSLMSLLDENQSIITNITEKKRPSLPVSCSSSNSSLKQEADPTPGFPSIMEESLETPTVETTTSATSSLKTATQQQEDAIKAAQRATGAIPKIKPLPAIVEPGGEATTNTTSHRPKRKLDKARSVSPSSSTIASNDGLEPRGPGSKVVRQSSVPIKLEEMALFPTTTCNTNGSSSSSSNKTSPSRPSHQGSSSRDQDRYHLSLSTSDTSGIQVRTSKESLTESIDSFPLDKKSKTPSPSKSDESGGSGTEGRKSSAPQAPHPAAIQPPNQKKMSGGQLKKIASTDSDINLGGGGSCGGSRQESFDLPPLEEEVAADLSAFPVHRRKLAKRGRDDSTESSVPSAKSSVQYSDTSSLLSHRFSTISISSNVSSSDVSLSAGGGPSGSSCYLASMSSVDFDDRPVLASSFSLSEAEADAEGIHQPQPQPQQQLPPIQPATHRAKLRTAFRRGPMASGSLHKQDSLLPTTAEEAGGGSLASPKLDKSPRSRIGTETSIETSIENPTCIDHGDSFEEELLHALSRDDDEDDEDDEVMMDANPMRRGSSKAGSSNNSGSGQRASLSAASSQDSLHSDSGGSQTYHRYYHVFKEGELDYLINTYVDNLHIINSYYDHANWCIVAEKVNVWTI